MNKNLEHKNLPGCLQGPQMEDKLGVTKGSGRRVRWEPQGEGSAHSPDLPEGTSLSLGLEAPWSCFFRAPLITRVISQPCF